MSKLKGGHYRDQIWNEYEEITSDVEGVNKINFQNCRPKLCGKLIRARVQSRGKTWHYILEALRNGTCMYANLLTEVLC